MIGLLIFVLIVLCYCAAYNFNRHTEPWDISATVVMVFAPVIVPPMLFWFAVLYCLSRTRRHA